MCARAGRGIQGPEDVPRAPAGGAPGAAWEKQVLFDRRSKRAPSPEPRSEGQQRAAGRSTRTGGEILPFQTGPCVGTNDEVAGWRASFGTRGGRWMSARGLSPCRSSGSAIFPDEDGDIFVARQRGRRACSLSPGHSLAGLPHSLFEEDVGHRMRSPGGRPRISGKAAAGPAPPPHKPQPLSLPTPLSADFDAALASPRGEMEDCRRVEIFASSRRLGSAARPRAFLMQGQEDDVRKSSTQRGTKAMWCWELPSSGHDADALGKTTCWSPRSVSPSSRSLRHHPDQAAVEEAISRQEIFSSVRKQLKGSAPATNLIGSIVVVPGDLRARSPSISPRLSNRRSLAPPPLMQGGVPVTSYMAQEKEETTNGSARMIKWNAEGSQGAEQVALAKAAGGKAWHPAGIRWPLRDCSPTRLRSSSPPRSPKSSIRSPLFGRGPAAAPLKFEQ